MTVIDMSRFRRSANAYLISHNEDVEDVNQKFPEDAYKRNCEEKLCNVYTHQSNYPTLQNFTQNL